jgi:hypothetical protein
MSVWALLYRITRISNSGRQTSRSELQPLLWSQNMLVPEIFLSLGILRSVDCFFTDVSGQNVGSNLQGPTVREEQTTNLTLHNNQQGLRSHLYCDRALKLRMLVPFPYSCQSANAVVLQYPLVIRSKTERYIKRDIRVTYINTVKFNW